MFYFYFTFYLTNRTLWSNKSVELLNLLKVNQVEIKLETVLFVVLDLLC